MSRTDNSNLNIKRKHLSGKVEDNKSGISLKDSKAASIKHVQSQSSGTGKGAAAPKAPKKVTFVNTDDVKEAPPAQERTIDLIWSSDEPEPEPSSRKIKWAFLIPAVVVIVFIIFFSAASYAGWIQSFLTPEEKLIKETTTPEETTTPVPTTTEKPTTTKETTTEETTTEFIPSYYVINVNLAYNLVTVYTRGEKLNDGWDPKDPLDDEYDLHPAIAFTCSPGIDGATPTGRFYLKERAAWCFMIGDVYTQYATRIQDDVMFHSVPYYEKDPSTLETDQYNILGYEASSACIRLNVRDAAWIFNSCAEGTEVNIFYNWDYYGPLDPEPIYRIPEDIPQLAGWDPTDIYSAGNPWFTYSAGITSDHVSVPCYSSTDSLVNAIGPTDTYGNNLSNHFYTDGGYYLDTPGTYTTTGHIQVADLSFSFPLTITVTEDYAQEYYENSWDEYSEDDGSQHYDWEQSEDTPEEGNDWEYTDSNEDYDWGSQEGDQTEYTEEYYSEEGGHEDTYQDNAVADEDSGHEDAGYYEEPAVQDHIGEDYSQEEVW